MFRKEKIARHPEYNWEHKTVLGEQNIGLDFMYQQVPYLLTTSCCDIYIYIYIYWAEGQHKPSVTT